MLLLLNIFTKCQKQKVGDKNNQNFIRYNWNLKKKTLENWRSDQKQENVAQKKQTFKKIGDF